MYHSISNLLEYAIINDKHLFFSFSGVGERKEQEGEEVWWGPPPHRPGGGGARG